MNIVTGHEDDEMNAGEGNEKNGGTFSEEEEKEEKESSGSGVNAEIMKEDNGDAKVLKGKGGSGKRGGKGKGGDREDYTHLLETAKPKGARYLTEKYLYWLEYHSPIVRQKVSEELREDKERILHMRMISSMFGDYHVMERTGYTFTSLYPGIELCEGPYSAKVFDMLLRGNNGTSLFILFLGSTDLTPKRLAGQITSYTGFLREHLEELTRWYGIGRSIHLGLLLTEREKPSLRRGIQMFGATDGSREFGEVHVMELSLENCTLHGFPTKHGDQGVGLGFPEGILLNSPSLDLRSLDYLLFETAAIQGCYAEHLMEGRHRPKEMTIRELESALFRELELDRKAGTDLTLNFDDRKAFARKRLNSVLEMAVRINLLEDSSAEMDGGSGKARQQGPFRLICQGTDLTMVKRNIMKKYLDGMAEEGAVPLARKKAVDAYRRRFPRIDMTF